MSRATAAAEEHLGPAELEPWLLTPDYVDRMEQVALDAKPGQHVSIHPTVALQLVRFLRNSADVEAEYAEQVAAYEEGVNRAASWLEEGRDADTALHYLREADRKVHQAAEELEARTCHACNGDGQLRPHGGRWSEDPPGPCPDCKGGGERPVEVAP